MPVACDYVAVCMTRQHRLWAVQHTGHTTANVNRLARLCRIYPGRTGEVPLLSRVIKETILSPVNTVFVTWKVIWVWYVFFHAEFKYVIRIALPHTGFVW